jgi:ketosteroid isomerase-like protein
MAAVDDVDQLIEQYHLAVDEFLKGNPEPVLELWSRGDDVTLTNPYGGVAHGWEQVVKASKQAASTSRDGELASAEIVEKNVTPELAYVVEIEQAEAKLGGREDITPFALRSTMIFRPEEGEWKVVHRHADFITTPQPAESVIQE